MTSALAGLVSRYGLLAVFLTMTGESCGLPLPSEVVVPFAGVLAANGNLNFVARIAVSVTRRISASNV